MINLYQEVFIIVNFIQGFLFHSLEKREMTQQKKATHLDLEVIIALVNLEFGFQNLLKIKLKKKEYKVQGILLLKIILRKNILIHLQTKKSKSQISKYTLLRYKYQLLFKRIFVFVDINYIYLFIYLNIKKRILLNYYYIKK